MYIGKELSDEYIGSQYTYSLKGANAKAKANAKENELQGIPEMLEIAMGKYFRENSGKSVSGTPQMAGTVNSCWKKICAKRCKNSSKYSVAGFLTAKSVKDMMGIEGFVYLGAALAASVVKFLMGRIIIKFYGKKEGLHKRESWMVAGVLVLNLLIGLGMFQLELGKMSEKMRCGLIMCLLAGEFGGILLLETVYGKLGEYQKEKLELEFREKQEKCRKENLMDIYQIGREINHWRHDMNEKLEVLYRLQNKGCYGEVEKNIEKLCEELKQYPELPQETKNEGLNVALMKAIVRCRDEGIKFCYVVLGRVDKIDSIDMGNIMWNLFSNGIEACRQVKDERIMEVVVRDGEGETEIRLENSVQGSVLDKNPGFESRKENVERHGFGMETIFMIVEKYHGEYSCWEEDSRFIQEIYLKNEQ